MIRMVNNTKNGYADAYSESEAADLEAKGWARFVPATLPETVAPELAYAIERIDAPRRGRPAKRIDPA